MHHLLELSPKGIQKPSIDQMDFHHLKWLDLQNPTESELKKISEIVKIPISELKAFLDRDELPRVSEVEHFSVVIFKCPAHIPRRKDLSTTSVAFLLSDRLIITMHKDEIQAISDFKNLSEEKLKLYFQKGLSQIFYELVQDITSYFFSSLDEIEAQINKIEDTVFSHPNQNTVKRIFGLKRTLIYFHKGLAANRDVLINLQKDYGKNIKNSTRNNLTRLYYDTVQLIDVVATYRDILTGSLDIYLSAVSNNMNAVMKKMAAYGTLVLVPTFITGLYGMNFTQIPELSWDYGYYFAWLMILVSIIVLTIYFKKEDWF